MLSWGYDVRKKGLVTGGYLEAMASSNVVGEQVGALINQAIAAKMPLADFKKQFKSVFINPDGLGMLERYYDTKTHDLFQKYDRQVNKVYADELKLNWAVWAGTVMSRTRPICEKNNNKCFHRSELEELRNVNFKGKPKIYDPFTDVGGYNCRHHLSWVSAEIAKSQYGRNIEDFEP